MGKATIAGKNAALSPLLKTPPTSVWFMTKVFPKLCLVPASRLVNIHVRGMSRHYCAVRVE